MNEPAKKLAPVMRWALENTEGSTRLTENTVGFFCHRLSAGQTVYLPAGDGGRVLFVCEGEACAGKQLLKRHSIHAGEAKAMQVCAQCDSLLLEIRTNADALAYALHYEDAPTYREDCKSEKTVSRMLLPARTVQGFAMGSVQTAGRDLIAPHSHPDVDQYFFGLSENNCVLLIEGKEYPFGGNELVHIPLGSTHGVLLEEEHICHYLWMDILLNEAALTYMDEAHKLQGEAL